MYDLGCPSDFTVDIHVITMVRIRLWLIGIISAKLDLRMLQLLCRLPIRFFYIGFYDSAISKLDSALSKIVNALMTPMAKLLRRFYSKGTLIRLLLG